MRKAKNLKNTGNEAMKQAIIVPDLTKKEREKDKELRQELKEKREAGEEGWYIRKGQLCRRPFL